MPAAIIVGIVGVETIYGQQTGNYRVMDALCTLAFDFPTAHPKVWATRASTSGGRSDMCLLPASLPRLS